MVEIEVGVAEGMHEIAGLKTCHLRHHLKKQGIGRYIERHAKEAVGTALIELKAEAPVGHIELEKSVAGRQVHIRQVCHIPRAHYDTARIGIMLYRFDGFRYLVDRAADIVGPRTPLIAVDMAEIAVRTGPFVPYPHTVFLQIAHIGIAAQKPQQFVYNRLEMQLLGSDEREALVEVETHLVAEHRFGAGAGAIGFHHSVVEYMLKKVEILFHMFKVLLF